jgi:hypothetical protein
MPIISGSIPSKNRHKNFLINFFKNLYISHVHAALKEVGPKSE